MTQDWQTLLKMTDNKSLVIERVSLPEKGIHIEGKFELPPLAQLSYEDQLFVSAFIQSHGSIKDMEKLFGASYPTIKNRLNAISNRLFLTMKFEVETLESQPTATAKSKVLERLARGEITSNDALKELRNL